MEKSNFRGVHPEDSLGFFWFRRSAPTPRKAQERKLSSWKAACLALPAYWVLFNPLSEETGNYAFLVIAYRAFNWPFKA